MLEKLIYARVEPILNLLLSREQAEFRREKSTVDQVILLTENIKDFLSIYRSDGDIWLYMASCSYIQAAWDFFQISTLLEWSCSWSKPEVSPLLPATASEARITAWKRLFSRIDLGSPLFQPLYIYVYICPPKFPESLPTQTILHRCTPLETGRPLRGLITLTWQQHFT